MSLKMLSGLSKSLRQSCLVVGATLALTTLSSTALAAADSQRYIVKFKPGTAAQVQQAVQARGGQIKLQLSRHHAVAVALPVQALSGLRNNPNIEYIELDPEKSWFAQRVPYAVPMIQADLLDDSLSGNQKICVIDTGVDASHADLLGNQLSGHGTWYQDNNGHGTLMVSTIAAINNDIGVLGAASNGHIQIHMISIWERFGSSFIKALDSCQDAGANIVTISAGSATNSRTETAAFEQAYANGLLMMAAAGNDGDNTVHFPSSYPGVISVGAVDKYQQHAPYSVQNQFIELVAPGSGILAAYTTQSNEQVREAALTLNGIAYDATPTINSVNGSVAASLVDCGNGSSICQDALGKVCLISISSSKDVTNEVSNCAAGGGVAALVHGDQFIIGYGEGLVTAGSTNIPVVNLLDSYATVFQQQPGAIVTVDTFDSEYKLAYGTSLSSPYVAAAAALVWSHHPQCSNEQIRHALVTTAQDLGAAGRDNFYGFGLVQAAAAKAFLDSNPCGSITPPGDSNFVLTVGSYRVKSQSYADLNWAGSTTANVQVYRDGNLITTVTNTGNYSEAVARGASHGYKVCDTDSTSCSNTVTLVF